MGDSDSDVNAPQARENTVCLTDRQIIDLSLPLHSGMPVYPGDPGVSFHSVSKADLASERFTVTEITLGVHAGTHIDAPAHLLPGGCTVDAFPLSLCTGAARVVDCTGLECITLDDLKARLPGLTPGSRILLRTDWDAVFGTTRYYDAYPDLTLPAVQWLADHGIALLGLETPSICRTEAHAAHIALLQKGIVVVEGLARLREIPGEQCWFAALPLALSGVEGSPVRAVAWPL